MASDTAVNQAPLTPSNPRARELKTIARGGGISLIGNVVALVLGLLFQLALARSLGPARVGILTLALSVVGLVRILTVFGLHRGVLRFVTLYQGSGEKDRVAGAIHTALRFTLVASLVATPLLLLGAGYLATAVFGKPQLAPVLRILALSLPFAALTELFLAVAQAFKRVEYTPLIDQMLGPGLKIVLLLLAVYAFSGAVTAVAYGILVATVVSALVAGWVLHRLYREYGLAGQRPVNLTGALLRFSWPLLLTALLGRLWGQVGTLLLGGLASAEQVGIYEIAVRVTILIPVFLEAFNAIFAPVIGEMQDHNSREQLLRLYQTVTRWTFLLSLPAFLVLFLFSAEVMRLFGPEFVAGAAVLRVLAVSQMVFIITGPSGWILTMSGRSGMNLLNTVLTMAIALALGFWLIPPYGALGAAVGSAASIAFVNILRLIEVFVILRGQPYNRSYLKPVAAGLLAVAVVVGTGALLPTLPALARAAVLSGVLCLVYLLALALLRFDEEDQVVLGALRQQIRRLGRRRRSEP